VFAVFEEAEIGFRSFLRAYFPAGLVFASAEPRRRPAVLSPLPAAPIYLGLGIAPLVWSEMMSPRVLISREVFDLSLIFRKWRRPLFAIML
jgi:hypothetical protein